MNAIRHAAELSRVSLRASFAFIDMIRYVSAEELNHRSETSENGCGNGYGVIHRLLFECVPRLFKVVSGMHT